MKKIWVVVMALALVCGCIETGRGVVTDTVHSMEYSGLLCKTQKVWLTNDHAWGGCSGDSCTGSDATYSVDPNHAEVMPILQKAKDENKKVTLTYRTEAFTTGCFDGLHSGYAIIETAKIQE